MIKLTSILREINAEKLKSQSQPVNLDQSQTSDDEIDSVPVDDLTDYAKKQLARKRKFYLTNLQ